MVLVRKPSRQPPSFTIGDKITNICRMKRRLPVTAGFLALGFLGSFCVGARAAEPERPFIEVTGVGEASAPPDRARMDFGVQTSGSDPRKAEEENIRRGRDFLKGLERLGLPSKDIQTSFVSLQPRYDYTSGRPKLIDYQASKTIAVVLEDLALYGGVLNGALESGVVTLSGFQLQSSREKSLEEEARKNAALDAQRKAAAIAGALGQKIGPAISASEGGFERPVPVPRMAFAAAAPAMPAPTDQIAPGEIKIAGTLDVKFSLLP